MSEDTPLPDRPTNDNMISRDSTLLPTDRQPMLSQGTIEIKVDRVRVLGCVWDDHLARFHTRKQKTVDEDEIADFLSDSAEVVRAPKTRELLRLLYQQLLDSLSSKGLESTLDESNASLGFSAV
ncbi:hypothetical protein ACH5RR_002897 [Cinchona calisaya]|uniref:Uncharacterized protein n=1 Tax=Cinchona calisaya TaxID=153742 RepID=A0ABD3ATA0_9GENT